MAARARLTRAGPVQTQWPAQARHAPLAARGACCRRAAAVRVMALSPFDQIDAQMAAMDRQFDALQRQMDRDMDAAFRDMDRAMERSFRDVQRVQQQVDEEVARAVREAQQQQPAIRVELSEARSYSSYRYYQSIEIRSGPIAAALPAQAAAAPPSMASPLLIAALATGAAWAAVTALFARNFEFTTYSEEARLKLLAQWPYLAAFSKRFRAQFLSALRGEKVKVAKEEQEGGGAGGSS